MVKYFLTSFLCLMLIGCNSLPMIKTEQFIPLLYCPAPPNTDRPTLPILSINVDTPAGEVAKKYKASVLILQGYSQELEKIINEYNRTNDAYSELRKRFKNQWKQEFKNSTIDIK